jgi:nicotinate-nucleotide adenylyltransferase
VRLGIFGGTFDPPHIAHLVVAQDAACALGLDRVLFVPAAVPPHKPAGTATAGEIRLDMVRAAVHDARFEVSDLEISRPGPSYTVDTLRQLSAHEPADQLILLMGADQFREFSSWREPEAIARLARVVVLTRGDVASPLVGVPFEHDVVAVTRIDLSSTDIRRRVQAGLPIRYLVPSAVAAIIHDRRLYVETTR